MENKNDALNYICTILKEQVDLSQNLINREFSLLSELSKNHKSQLLENEKKILLVREDEIDKICK